VNGSLGYFTLSGLAATTALTTADIKVSTISLVKQIVECYMNNYQ
jgi:hypothetical protein